MVDKIWTLAGEIEPTPTPTAAPTDTPEPAGFATDWRQRMYERLGENMPEWSGRYNPGLPTAKSWVRNTYGVTAITYEAGDSTSRETIRITARVAAEEMMSALMANMDKGP